METFHEPWKNLMKLRQSKKTFGNLFTQVTDQRGFITVEMATYKYPPAIVGNVCKLERSVKLVKFFCVNTDEIYFQIVKKLFFGPETCLIPVLLTRDCSYLDAAMATKKHPKTVSVTGYFWSRVGKGIYGCTLRLHTRIKLIIVTVYL